jgi:hypothetical protein
MTRWRLCAAALSRSKQGSSRSRIAPRPEPDVAARDVEIAALAAEIAEVRLLRGPLSLQELRPPAVEHGQPGAAVTQRDRQVQPPVGELDDAAVTGHVQPVVVPESHPLDRVVLPGGDQHRPQPRQHRELGHPRRAVRRLDRAERGDSEHQRPTGSRERGDRDPVSHQGSPRHKNRLADTHAPGPPEGHRPRPKRLAACAARVGPSHSRPFGAASGEGAMRGAPPRRPLKLLDVDRLRALGPGLFLVGHLGALGE